MPENSRSAVRWGILATGSIAHVFARDLALVDEAALHAVGSRDLASATAFAAEHGVARAYGSYEELVADPDVEVVYVATPHGRHVDDVLLCLEHGKHVLCEKPLTLTSRQAEHLIDEARARGLFLAEAMWMRTQPNIRAVKALVDDGAVGEVTQLRAELGFVADPAMARLWDPTLGASALLDVGIYPLTLAHLLLGPPETAVAAGTVRTTPSGAFDVAGGATLTYARGAVASIAWTQVAASDNRAVVAGALGRIEWGPRMHEPVSFTVVAGDAYADGTRHAEPVVGAGYTHEIIEVGACLRRGLTESGLLPLDETLAILRLLDDMRRQMGVRYPVD